MELEEPGSPRGSEESESSVILVLKAHKNKLIVAVITVILTWLSLQQSQTPPP